MKIHRAIHALTGTALAIVLAASPAANADTPEHTYPATENTCSVDTGTAAGDDDIACYLNGFNFYEFADPGQPDTYILSDGAGGDIGVSDVGMVDPAIGMVAYAKYSDGFRSLSLWINYDTSAPFSWTFTDGSGVTHTVSVLVNPYVPPAAPTIRKAAHKKGYLQGKEPTRADNGIKVVVAYGTFDNPSPDCFAVLSPNNIWKNIRVHRHQIDFEVYEYATGNFVDVGHVRGIKLPKGDHAPTTQCRKITGGMKIGNLKMTEVNGKWRTLGARINAGASVGSQRHGVLVNN